MTYILITSRILPYPENQNLDVVDKRFSPVDSSSVVHRMWIPILAWYFIIIASLHPGVQMGRSNQLWTGILWGENILSRLMPIKLDVNTSLMIHIRDRLYHYYFKTKIIQFPNRFYVESLIISNCFRFHIKLIQAYSQCVIFIPWSLHFTWKKKKDKAMSKWVATAKSGLPGHHTLKYMTSLATAAATYSNMASVCPPLSCGLTIVESDIWCCYISLLMKVIVAGVV